MKTLTGAMRRRPLVSYFLLTYVLSWSVWIPMLLAHQRVIQGRGIPTHFAGLLGPLVAAVIVTAVTQGKAGIRDLLTRMGRWRVSWRWYVVAFSPLGFFAVAAVVVAASGRGWPAWHDLGLFGGIPAIGAIGVWAVLTAINGFGEETGWRGYATPKLREKRTLLKASLILGVFWAAWHTPTFFILQRYRDLGASVIPGFLLGVFAGAIFLTWLYERAGNSILLVTLWHGTYNLTSGTVAASKHGAIAAIVSTAVMAWAGIIVIAELRAHRRSSHGKARRVTAPKYWNPFVRAILRSPLHGMLSRSLVVVSVRGRKTGLVHSFPVGYVEDGRAIYVLVGDYETKSWWRNFEDSTSARLTIRGETIDAIGQTLHADRDPDDTVRALVIYLRAFPRAARHLDIAKLDDPESIRTTAQKVMIVRFHRSAASRQTASRVEAA